VAEIGWGFGNQNKVPWPQTPDGLPVTPAFLMHLKSADMEGDITMNMLSVFGIPTIAEYPNDGSFGRVILGISGTGVDIYVPETMLEDACGLVDEKDED